MGVSTKREPIAPRADLSAKFYSVPLVNAGGSAALGRWGRADVTAATAVVDVAAIVSAAVAAETATIFCFLVVIVILRRSAKEEASCYRVLLG
jgi:hypothetical protein